MTRRASLATALAALLAIGAAPPPPSYDLVIAGGRVVDPESGLDAVRSIGITGGRIAAISTTKLSGKRVIDASGLVVSPGFVDIHSHAQTTPSAWMQAHDGVTTALELEIGAWPVDTAYRTAASEGRPINYGFAVSWIGARQSLFGDRAEGLIGAADGAKVIAAVEQGLAQGAIGIGLPIGHHPETDRGEYLELARLAAKRGVPTFTHVRAKNTHEPRGVVEGVTEVIGVAAATGAHMHICHINSSALRETPRMLGMIAAAEKAGIKVSTEAYPWGAGSTRINTPFLAPENLPLLDIKPSNITVLRTGERPASDERLRSLRKTDPTEMVTIHYLDEAVPGDLDLLDMAARFPGAIVASDAIPYQLDGKIFTTPTWPLPAGARAHPRITATFSKFLARQVRETRAMTLLQALARATILPARLLEPSVPAMRRKGRIRVGADADIVAFDLTAINGRASFDRPAEPAVGMRYVIVGGTPVIDNARLDTAVRPGKAILTH